jgi:hypothetical protein
MTWNERINLMTAIKIVQNWIQHIALSQDNKQNGGHIAGTWQNCSN